ncbi:YmfQ family protein [Roseomonas elaeocarpi]|uniref:YmfQ family protein n=1 Tax=Roseomonas elaeocarpi TaxID=907779 RepID=A0ABV6JTJ4_9PROT
MGVLRLSASHLLTIFQKLLPRGAVWPRDPTAGQTRALGTLMPTYARLLTRDNNLLVDAFPSTTYELLPEWESSLGLPDSCIGDTPSTQQRVARVVARLTATGGQSRAYFIAQAAALGYAVTITEFKVARAGLSRVGDRLNGEAWGHAWRITAPAQTVTYARAGRAAAGDALAAWGNAALVCTMSRIRPAHTVLQIAYGD